MQRISVKDVVEATRGELICGDLNKIISNVSTDSRTLDGDTLFVPIVGERFDGHDFTGSSQLYITARDEKPQDNKCIIKVNDTLLAFGKIAGFYKQKYNRPTISVVGSVGKTTTRDMTHSVMSAKYNTLKTCKNFNNNIGVPIMIFKLENEHEAAVLELGMSGFGEIEYLADIVRPDTVIMTNIGMSHIENLGSQEGIFKAKTEFLKFFTKDNTVIANGDDDFLKNVDKLGDFKTIYYGINNPACEVKALNIKDKGLDGCEFDISYNGEEYHVRLFIPGSHNIYNALAAFTAGVIHGVDPQLAAEALGGVSFTEMRMDISTVSGLKIINDCYNAAPSSVKAALDVLSKAEGRKVAVLGDILEMGSYAKDAHIELGRVAATKTDVLVCVGENGAYIGQGALGMDKLYTFDTTDKAAKTINSIIEHGDTILLKASRGMHFEKIFNAITEGR